MGLLVKICHNFLRCATYMQKNLEKPMVFRFWTWNVISIAPKISFISCLSQKVVHPKFFVKCCQYTMLLVSKVVHPYIFL